jgi:hypothetical protein
MILKSEDWMQNNDTFLSIFRAPRFEKATLIWNQEMLEHLKDEILKNLKPYFLKWQLYIQEAKEEIPSARHVIKYVVSYPNIVQEVRCGQYYLRIWVDQKIPQ